ncbi:GmrSD restriction endonuclease domain-containing protein [Pedobacter agri]|uniref:GmrSD restriction endonuclease domain-containing protein n=1 Tax=Pedobacter agri TaxID=454586 RepID=UPI00292D38BF|nr:DUF262 domain-containing protein [Pedobacter agri]
MQRTEIIENGQLLNQEPFTDFNEFEELIYVLRDNGLSPNPILNGRGGYHVVEITEKGRPIRLHLYLKKVTFGGRENRPEEKRAQFSAALDRRGYQAKDEPDNISLIIGIYKSSADIPPIICSWRIEDWGQNIGRAFNCFTDVKCIQASYAHMIAQHKTAVGQISCAFRPEFFKTYLNFRNVVHVQLVEDEDLLKSDPESMSPLDTDGLSFIPKMEDLLEPVMTVLRSHGGVSNVEHMEEEIAEMLELSQLSRGLIHNLEEGYRTELGYRLAWARFYLRMAGLVTSPKRKIWKLTQLGEQTLVIDKNHIKRLRSHQQAAQEIDQELFSDAEQQDGVEVEQGNDDLRIATPFDPNLVDIRTKSMSLDLILKRLNRQTINMFTSFQRKAGLWGLSEQSRLIESILVKIPLPVFYFDGSDDENWLVVDGLQRLSALDGFVNQESFALANLEFLDKFNGMKFSQLPPYLQRRIEEFEITAYIIAPGTPQNLKFNVFKRINTGGLTLSTQEIRNALHQGHPANFVKQLADQSTFKVATDFSISEDRMLDREFVNRFLAFYLLPIKDYQSDLEAFLNQAMEKLYDISALESSELFEAFNNGMKTATALFGIHAFRKLTGHQQGQKPINKALFEVWSVLLSKLDPRAQRQLIANKTAVLAAAEALEAEESFRKAISSSTNDKSRVKMRFDAINDLIQTYTRYDH